MKYIIAIGIFQALIAIVLLFKSKRRSGADEILIFLVACIAAHLLIKFVIFNFVGDSQVRLQMNTFLGLCYGPLLYLYARKLKDPAFIPATRWYVFIPFIAAMMAYFSVGSVLIAAPGRGYDMLKWYNNVVFWLIIPSDIYYSLRALRLSGGLSRTFSREVRLVRQIAAAFLFMAVLGMIFYAVHVSPAMNITVRCVCYSVLVLLCVIILRYRFLAIQQPAALRPGQAFQPEPEEVLPVPNAVEEPGIIMPLSPESDARKPLLAIEEQVHIWNLLEMQMKASNPFTDGTLSLDKLAGQTGISKYHISETLNSYAGKSFYQYVNEYRVQFAIERMKYLTGKEVPVNILSLAYDAGFNAKSSFNRYFKEITGHTPSAYLKSLQGSGVLDNYVNGALG